VHTETIPYDGVYTVRLPGLRVVHVEKQPRESEAVYPPLAVSPAAYNTLVGFGDSITWGKIRMNDLPGEYHPELAYLGVMQTYLAENYRPVNAVNLGVPGETTYAGLRRLDDDFTGLEGYFCMIMFGTNDVGQNSFSSGSSVENLEWICTRIRDKYGMYPVISTIPPMTHISGEQYLKENSEELNGKIIEMATDNNIPYVDTYAAFFAEPDWEILVEDIIGSHVVGNHPSPAGHQVIAGLFLNSILLLPPEPPAGFQTMTADAYRLVVQWTGNYEFDFGHYDIEFGYTAANLNRHLETANSFYTFTRPPFQFSTQSYIYFRVRAVDKDGYSSNFTDIMSVEFK
jgi:lysophospholipase L1-like esterase